MKKKPLLFALGALALLAAVTGGWWFQQASGHQAQVTALLPPPPDLSAAPELLRESIDEADTRARSLRHARRGFVELSRLYHANGFLDEALHCYRGLARLEPTEARWPHLEATILAGYGDIDPAIALWQRVVQLAPDYAPARLRLGDSFLKANRFDEATATYQAVLQKNPADAYAMLGLARLDLEAGRDDSARERLEAIVRQTNFQLGYDLIVSLYERTGQRERAAAIRGANKASGAHRDPPDPWVDELIEACLDPYRLSLAAGVAARNADPATARHLLERAIEIEPTDVSAHFQLGTLSADQGDLATARAQFERCTTLAPDFADGWAQLSALQAQSGDKNAADRTLANGLRHCPESPGLHLMRARSLKSAGRTEEALNAFMVSIRLRPNEPEAYIELGNTLITLGREAEGVEQMKQALETDPANPAALAILGLHAISTGDETLARQWLARVNNQPRVPQDHIARLKRAYRQQFNHDWQP